MTKKEKKLTTFSILILGLVIVIAFIFIAIAIGVLPPPPSLTAASQTPSIWDVITIGIIIFIGVIIDLIKVLVMLMDNEK
ncbi:MAG: hypothetical protein QXN16_02980 [Candidatus Micrarchaeaceae archaeon]